MLAELKCSACKEGDPPLTDDEINAYHIEVPRWQVLEDAGV